jgi:hypothetical protein
MILLSPLFLALIGYWLYGIFGITYSAAVQATIAESLRLGILVAVFAAAAYMLEKEDIPRILKAVHITGLLLAPLAIIEKLTGSLFWQSDTMLYRINTTFIDPNIYARYIVLAIAANLVLTRLTTSRRDRVLYWLAMAVLLAQLVLTDSRGGVLAFLVVLVLAFICLPRRKDLAVLTGGVLIGGLGMVLLNSRLWQRVTEIGELFTDEFSARRYLIEAALAVFKDNVVYGTGLGSFPAVFAEDYSHLLTVPGGPVRSHTTVLTIAAEQGIIGLLFVAVLFLILIVMLVRLYLKYHPGYYTSDNLSSYLLGAGCFLWAAAIFVSSQAEGRLFEDPLLWLTLAMMIVLNRERMMTF